MLESGLENSSGRNANMSSGIALGRITAVDAKKRFCTVKTFFGDSHLVDKTIPICQWLSTDANPEGDETTSIPRVNSTGLVFFVAGEAFIWGYFRATTKEKGATTGKEQSNLNEGDKTTSTVAGNRVTLKANGVIEIQSKETLKTIYFPKEGLLAHLCEAYDIRTDGGSQNWKTTNEILNQTLYQALYKRETLPLTGILFEERGTVTSDLIHRIQIGPAIPGKKGVSVPLYEETIGITGEKKVSVGVLGTGIEFTTTPLGGHKMQNLLASSEMNEKGAFEWKNNFASVTVSETGDIVLKNTIAEISATVTGDIAVKNAVASITASKTGDIELKNALAGIKASAAGLVAMGNKSAELLDLFNQTLSSLVDALAQMAAIIVGTGTGPSSPPTNAAAIAAVSAKVAAIQAQLALLKGSL